MTEEVWMPYHLRERQAAWCRCGKAATHEVRNERNDVMDWCCKRCGDRRVTELRQVESVEKLPPPMAV